MRRPGRTVSLDGRPLTIVGVTPPGLNIPLSQNPAPDIWVPKPFKAAANGGNGILKPGPAVFAVLRPGVSVEAASRELQTIASSFPSRVQDHASIRVMRAQDFLDARQTRALQVLFAAVGALLLAAVALLSAYLPTRRALGVDPTEALRAE